MENKKFKKFGVKDGNKFLSYIKSGQVYAQYEYKTNCFLIWSNGLIAKQEGEKQYTFITTRGWVEI
jgi:hypothetical protein